MRDLLIRYEIQISSAWLVTMRQNGERYRSSVSCDQISECVVSQSQVNQGKLEMFGEFQNRAMA